ncbi:MAG TPA: hypothetical protein VK915_13115 [Gaiellaceae bacterium]|nr:hypothetical protein [Gaiellaceae bacterium]
MLGAAVGTLAALALPGLELAPALAAGVASSAAAVLGMPFFAVVMATLLFGESAVLVAPLAILGAAVGWLVSVAAARE